MFDKNRKKNERFTPGDDVCADKTYVGLLLHLYAHVRPTTRSAQLTFIGRHRVNNDVNKRTGGA